MVRLLTVMAVLGWLSLPPVLWRLRGGMRGTSLCGIWRFVTICWIAWGIAAAVTLAGGSTAGIVDVLWYFVAVVLLIPPIAVLGARRPINRVWPWFVLCPLILVFSWPALTALAAGQAPAAWSVEEPIFAGYCLVAIMGAGNYLGLRHTLSALLWIAALLLLVGPLCPSTATRLPTADMARAWATILISASAWFAVFQSGGQAAGASDSGTILLNRVWLDFREAFGIVWARRVQERFNDDMHRQRRRVCLTLHGLERTTGSVESTGQISPDDLAAAETALRWLLQKFVDVQWIEARLIKSPRSSTADDADQRG